MGTDCLTCGGPLSAGPATDSRQRTLTDGNTELLTPLTCVVCTTLHHRKDVITPGGVTVETNVIQDTSNENAGPGRTELLERLRRLQKQLQQVEGDKKSAATDYNDQIKDLKSEIKTTLVDLDDLPATDAEQEAVDAAG